MDAEKNICKEYHKCKSPQRGMGIHCKAHVPTEYCSNSCCISGCPDGAKCVPYKEGRKIMTGDSFESIMSQLKDVCEDLGHRIDKATGTASTTVCGGDEYVLKLRVVHGQLWVGFYFTPDHFELIGSITADGKCRMLSTDGKVESYYLWRDNGMKIDSTPVKWRGGDYYIDSDGNLIRSDIRHGVVHSFCTCEYIDGCQDPNIIRFKHNNRPRPF